MTKNRADTCPRPAIRDSPPILASTANNKWEKVFTNGLSKIFKKLSSTNFTWSILEYFDLNLVVTNYFQQILKSKSTDEKEKQIAAAVEIQKVWRGYRTRLLFYFYLIVYISICLGVYWSNCRDDFQSNYLKTSSYIAKSFQTLHANPSQQLHTIK